MDSSKLGNVVRTAVLWLGLAGIASAAPPNDMSYQGFLRDASGQPLTGPASLEIGIWTAADGGSVLYREAHPDVALRGGTFQIPIGSGSVLEGVLDAATFAGPDRYLEVTVNGETLAPRRAMRSTPYALQAATAGTAQSALEAGRAAIRSHQTSFRSFSIANTGVAHNEGAATVACPAGHIASGGGFSTGSDCLRLKQSYPSGNGWRVRLLNECNFHTASVNVWARCVAAAP